MKAREGKLKMKKIKKYARDMENCLHYALAIVVILFSVVIALSGITRCK
jgi:Cu/Ag efflux pump CusA